MMSQLIKWLNTDLEIHPVLISGIAQFQLVHIHPFLDGNGRTSRLLSTLCLYKTGYDFSSLQRDFKIMIEKGILESHGETNKLTYMLKG